jgi:hypothetical protein
MTTAYLVWSNEHRAWWRAGSYGYSTALPKAGRYTREEALEICRRALPTAMHIGAIAEVPVRLDDMADILRDQIVPGAIIEEHGERARPPLEPKSDQDQAALARLWAAIVDNAKGDLFWIGEVLLSELSKETGFRPRD